MYYHHGFNGYREHLGQLFQNAMDNMVNIVAVNDDRFGNKFSSGPLRFKLYELGACQALLLDEVMPAWKDKIFADGIYLCNLIKQEVGLTSAELEAYLQRAKSEYKYDEAYQSKLQFESDGQKKVEEKLAAILQTDRTLVKISYEGFGDRIGLGGFTPFGVTQVSKRSAIYDLVPIKVLFKEGVELQMKQVTPVLIDREKKLIAFAISTPVSKFEANPENKLETDEFVLSGAKLDIQRNKNNIEICLK